jgi:hypothetical protein
MEIDVEQYEIGLAGSDALHVAMFYAFGDDVEAVVFGEQLAERFAKQGLLFDNSDANAFHPEYSSSRYHHAGS